MARPKVTTTKRQARGREVALPDQGLPIAVAAALDAVARHRATPGEPLERALGDVVKVRRLGPRERRATGDLVFGWARMRTSLEHLVDDALGKAGGIKPNRRDRDLAALLLASLAAGDEALVAVARDRMSPALDDLLDEVAAKGLPPGDTPLPAWLKDALVRAHGSEADALIAALGKPAPLVLAVDVRHVGVDRVVEAAGKKASRSKTVPDAVRIEGRLAISALPDDVRPHVWPMDDGSQAVAAAALAQWSAAPEGDGARKSDDAPKSDVGGGGARRAIFDMCAGGGGKSRWLLSRGVPVVSADPVPERLQAAPADALRLVADGTAPPFPKRSFTHVLVDAPCSGTGTLRRAPDVAQRCSPEDVARYAELQKALLTSALGLATAAVIYATCSLLAEENDHVVDAVAAATGATVRERRRLLPHKDGTDGFFIAVLAP